MKSVLTRALLVVVAFGAGCGGTLPAGPDTPPSFPAEALVAMPSSAGNFRIELRTDPQPPVRGAQRGELVITGPAGDAADGLVVSVLPWMPAHGHGSSVVPSVSPQGGGRYLVDQLYLYMAGIWELRTTISGQVNDEAAPQFQVP